MLKKFAQSAYRPDIDGLRAITVLAVILFHINKHLIPGGFVGVDIFFVISGYLISLHILRDIERGKFSLLDFYRRRVQRLALPLLLVVSLTLLTAFLLMLPDDFNQTANSGLFSLISLANVFFWLFQDTSYFAADSNTLPLLHLWSLGVEEQFYILWPLLLMFTYRSARIKIFFALAAVFALASFAFGEFWFQRDAAFAYYMLPSRAGELLAGAMVAMAVLRGIETHIPKSASTAMASIGMVLIIVSFGWLNEDQVFPGMRAVLPTLGAALLLLAGHCAKNRVSDLLASAPLVWVGLISYSAYLWHWPILAFLRYEHITISLVSGAIVLCVTLWWSFLSYMLVELPAREWNALPSRIFLFQYILPACVIALLLYLGKPHTVPETAMLGQEKLLTHDAAQSALTTIESAASAPQAAPEKVAQVANTERTQTTHENTIQPMFEIDTGLHEKPRAAFEFKYVCMPEHITAAELKNNRCVVGSDSTRSPRVILWGDSNAAHYVGVVGAIARQADFNFRNIATYSCPPLFNDPSAYVVAKRLAECRNALTPIKEAIHNSADVVIISAHWPDYFSHSTHFFDDLFATIKSLTADGKLVLIMAKAPSINSFDIHCQEKANLSSLPIRCALKELLGSDVISANTKLKEFAEHTPNVAFFDVAPYLCRDGVCSAYDAADHPLYYDSGHLSLAASWEIGDSIVRQEGVPPAFVEVAKWLKKTKQK